MNTKGKRKAPNGMYWGNVKQKAVMVEPLGNGQFRAWSNSTKFLDKYQWRLSEIRIGWGYMDFHENEIYFFDWN